MCCNKGQRWKRSVNLLHWTSASCYVSLNFESIYVCQSRKCAFSFAFRSLTRCAEWPSGWFCLHSFSRTLAEDVAWRRQMEARGARTFWNLLKSMFCAWLLSRVHVMLITTAPSGGRRDAWIVFPWLINRNDPASAKNNRRWELLLRKSLKKKKKKLLRVWKESTAFSCPTASCRLTFM